MSLSIRPFNYNEKEKRYGDVEDYVTSSLSDMMKQIVVEMMRDGSEWSLLYLLDGTTDFKGDFHFTGKRCVYDCPNKLIKWTLTQLIAHLENENLNGEEIPRFEVSFAIDSTRCQKGQVKLLYSYLAFLCQSKEDGFSEVVDLGSGVGAGGMNHLCALELAPVKKVYAYDPLATNEVLNVSDVEFECHRESVGVNFDTRGLPAYCDIYFNGEWSAIQDTVKSPLVMKKILNRGAGGNIYQPFHTEMRKMPGFNQMKCMMGCPQYAGFECSCWNCWLWNALIFRYKLSSGEIVGKLTKMGERPDSSVPGVKAMVTTIGVGKSVGAVVDASLAPTRFGKHYSHRVVIPEELELERVLENLIGAYGVMFNLTRRTMRHPSLNVLGGVPIFDDSVKYPVEWCVVISKSSLDDAVHSEKVSGRYVNVIYDEHAIMHVPRSLFTTLTVCRQRNVERRGPFAIYDFKFGNVGQLVVSDGIYDSASVIGVSRFTSTIYHAPDKDRVSHFLSCFDGLSQNESGDDDSYRIREERED